jgi:chromate transporter
VVPFRQAVRAWFAISLQTFGGPPGQIAVLQRTPVEERRWIGPQRFLHALNYCMLLPGPEAQQLAVYMGWLLNGLRGGLVARDEGQPAWAVYALVGSWWMVVP